MRNVKNWLAYQIVMWSPYGVFARGGKMRPWAKVVLPLAGEWAYRNESR